MNGVEPSKEFFLDVYKEVCGSYHAVDDFRAKLLALLPIASGVGGIVLLDNRQALSEHFVFIGLFGLVVTVGLFFFELRGIANCGRFIDIGRRLEKDLKIDNGVFGGSPPIEKATFGFISATTASWVVYTTVMLGWCYLMYVGVMHGG